MGEVMRFAPAEMSMEEGKAEVESKLAKLADQMAVIENRIRSGEGPGETLDTILEMEKIQREMAPLRADLKRLRILEAAGGVEAGFEGEAVRIVEKRAENAEAIKNAKGQMKALSTELEKAEAATRQLNDNLIRAVAGLEEARGGEERHAGDAEVPGGVDVAGDAQALVAAAVAGPQQ